MTGKIIEAAAGPITVAVDSGELIFCKWGKHPIPDEDPSTGDVEILSETERQLREYFAGERRDFSIPMRIRGTEFQKSVWRAAMGISYGATVTYGEIARRIGRPGATRAVGTALGANVIHIIIPCHRITAAASLGGYAAGLPTKTALLNLESKVACSDHIENR